MRDLSSEDLRGAAAMAPGGTAEVQRHVVPRHGGGAKEATNIEGG